MLRKEKKKPLLEEKTVKTLTPPAIPVMERDFFEVFLHNLYHGLQEMEKEIRKHQNQSVLLQKYFRVQATVSYAKSVLRVESLKSTDVFFTKIPFRTLVNRVAKALRREFLYAGVALHYPELESAWEVEIFEPIADFLLEEMMSCCLRCAPLGRNIYISFKQIDLFLLLVMRSEGPVMQQAPLISCPEMPDEASDYGFSLCQNLAFQLGWGFRWECDEAGVRMFLEVKL